MMPSEAHLFEQIAESLRIQIARGELQAGDRLPSIRELAEKWQCTPGTVNRAYAILGDEDLVTSRRGSGTVVSGNPLSDEQVPLKSAVLTNQIENILLNLLGQGYTEPEIEAAFAIALSRWHRWQQSALLGKAPQIENQLRFVGSHDLAIEYLADRMVATSDYLLKTSYRGSLGGLMALARGEADIAGSHLWDEETDSYNLPFVRRVLPGKRVALVSIAGRSFGLIAPTGNPQQIATLSDLANKGVKWVNRQPGSGTRVWLDAQLKNMGMSTAEIAGYENTKTTHNEVAEAIKQGLATAGLGIQAAASAYGLDFIPLAQELYQLVVPESIFETAVCQEIVTILQTDSFKESVKNLGGYETVETGNILWVG